MRVLVNIVFGFFVCYWSVGISASQLPRLSEVQREIERVDIQSDRFNQEYSKYLVAQKFLLLGRFSDFDDWISKNVASIKLPPKYLCELLGWALELGGTSVNANHLQPVIATCKPTPERFRADQRAENYKLILGLYHLARGEFNLVANIIKSISGTDEASRISKGILEVKLGEATHSSEMLESGVQSLEIYRGKEIDNQQFWIAQAAYYYCLAAHLLETDDIHFTQSDLDELSLASLYHADIIEYPVLWYRAMGLRADVLENQYEGMEVRQTDMGDKLLPIQGDVIDKREAQLRAQRARDISLRIY